MATANTPTTIYKEPSYFKKKEERNKARELRMALLDLSPTDDGSQFTFDLKDHNFKNLLGIRGIGQTTTNSVLVVEAPTTSVAGTTVTVTVGGSAGSSKKRSYLIFGEAN